MTEARAQDRERTPLYVCKLKNCPVAKKELGRLRKHLSQFHGLPRGVVEILLEEWGYSEREDPNKQTSITVSELRTLSKKAYPEDPLEALEG